MTALCAPADEAERAARTCAKIVEMSDGSRGLVEVNWTDKEPAGQLPGEQGSVRQATITNRGKRPITVNLRFRRGATSAYRLTRKAILERAASMLEDALDLTIDVPPEATVSREIVFKDYKGYEDDAGFFFSANAFTFAIIRTTGELVSTHYGQVPQTGPYCVERIRKATGLRQEPADPPCNRWRHGAVRLRTILSSRPYDQEFGRTYEIVPALALSSDDTVYFGSGNPYATLHVADYPSDQEEAEYDRLKQVLTEVCGEGVVESSPTAERPRDRMLVIERFAPKARFDLRLYIENRALGLNVTLDDGGGITAYVGADPTI